MEKNSDSLTSKHNPPILFIDLSNFENYPLGGTLSFAKQMMGAFKNQLILVGIATDKDTPVGEWIKKDINHITYDFFAIRRAEKVFKKPLIPDRIKNYIALRIYKREIKAYHPEIKNVFTQSHEALLMIKNWGYGNVCFRSPGLVNMLIASRFWYAKYFAKISGRLIYKALKKVHRILASADSSSIRLFINKSHGILNENSIAQFPTRMDTAIFKRTDKNTCRSELKLDRDSVMIVSTGRLSEQKGWKFMIDSFSDFSLEIPDSYFFLLGDGEDREKVESYIKVLKLEKKVFVTGSLSQTQIANYLNAADLYVMGSYIEGWATSLMEAIACAKPVCVTNFGSASDMIQEGENGYVIMDRDQKEFVTKMHLALKLEKQTLIDKSEYFSRFSLVNLKNDMLSLWQLS